MAIPTLRILTRKSFLSFGKYKDYRVQEMLDLRRNLDLISAYFKLTSINYQEDILIELKITKEYRIEKPGKDYDAYYKFLKENGFKKRKNTRDGPDSLKSFKERTSKSTLRDLNRKHR